MGQMYSFTIVLIASTHFAPFVGFASSPFAAAGAGAGAVVSLSSDEESPSVSNMVSSPRAICAGASRVPLDFDTLCSLSLCLVAQTGAVYCPIAWRSTAVQEMLFGTADDRNTSCLSLRNNQ